MLLRSLRNLCIVSAGVPTTHSPPSDSELLDMMDIDAELSTFLLQSPPDMYTPEHLSSEPPAASRVAAPPRSLLIGGSLFEPRPASLLRTHASAVPGRGLPEVRGPLTSAIFCPFTHQYVSVLSAHWQHLSRAGFGISSGKRGAHRVVLRFASRLRPYAVALQECRDAAKVDDASTQSALATHACRDALFASWHWSVSLQRTLGRMLLTVPVHQLNALEAAVNRELHTDQNYRDLRVVTSDGAGEGLRRGVERWRDLQWPAWRQSTPSTAEVRWTVEPCGNGASLPAAAPVAFPAWVGTFAERPSMPLLGLPPSVHAAFFELPFPSAPGSIDLMGPACVALLEQLSRDVTDAVRDGRLRTLPRLFYCPLAHGVDYHGVLDLYAFRITTDALLDEAARLSLADVCKDTHVATSVLSLGLESLEEEREAKEREMRTDSTRNEKRGEKGNTAAAPPLRIVVFDNAHLLSKRAISRMLDQWTRNASAARRYREIDNPLLHQQRRRAANTNTATDAAEAPRWQTLMGASVNVGSVLPHLRTLAPPFGDVQAVFLSYQVAESCHRAAPLAKRDADPTTLPPVVESGATRSLLSAAVRAVPRADLLFIEEPLSAALLRVSALYRLSLSPAQRRELLENVLRSTVLSVGGDVRVDIAVSRSVSSSGESTETVSYPLHTAKGQALLYEGCEAVLALLSPLDAFLHGTQGQSGDVDRTVQVLTLYPTLTTLRVRHSLLGAHTVTLRSGSGSIDEGDVGRRACAKIFPTPPRVSFLASRQLADERETQERMNLQRNARTRAASTASTSTAPHNLAPAVVAQTYAFYAEPPLLVGNGWTATLLFCAPTLADVVSLRTFLLHRLRRRFAAFTRHERSASAAAVSQLPPSDGVEDTERGQARHRRLDRLGLTVADVDVFHADFADGSAARPLNYRVFGVRALLQSSPSPPTAEAGVESAAARMAAAIRATHQLEWHLQCSLKACASRSLFFPLWTYRGVGVTHEQPGGDKTPSASMSESDGSSNDTTPPTPLNTAEPSAASHPFPSFQYATRRQHHRSPYFQHHRSSAFPDFFAVREWRSRWVPALVERRLFSLAVAQRAPAVLVLGTRVALVQPLRVPSPTGSADRTLPRGAMCTVVGFVELTTLFAEPHTGSARPLPPVVRQQVAELTAERRRQLVRYVEQQHDARTLPLLRCLRDPHVPHGVHFDHVFVLLPQPSLVGGYRSTHYYALPVLHLPICVVTGTRDMAEFAFGRRVRGRPPPPPPPQNAHASQKSKAAAPADGVVATTAAARAETCLTATAADLPIDFTLTSVFHPYYADSPHSKAAACLTREERTDALRRLFAVMESSSSSSSSDGDEGGAPKRQALNFSSASQEATFSPISFMEDVLFYDAAEVAPAPAPARPVSSAIVSPAIQCPLLTELALYARHQSS